jgi:predicted dehydrogenase
MVAFNYRRTPAVALAKRYIDEGAIGEIVNVRGTYLQDWSADPNSPLSWRFQKEVAGSGAIGDILTHVLDMVRYLAGEIVEVSSLTQHIIRERPLQESGLDSLGNVKGDSDTPKAPVNVEDEVLSLIRLASGAVGSVEATRNAWGRNNFLTIEVHGTEGSIFFNYENRDELQVCFRSDNDDRRGFRTVYTGPNHPNGPHLWPIPALGVGYGETKIIEAHDFFDAIVSGGSVSPDFGDGYQVALIDDAIARSAESGSWTKVPQLDRESRKAV